MKGAAYYVLFLLIAGLLYDAFSLDSKYFKKVLFEAKSYAVRILPKNEYQLSGQSRPYRLAPSN